MNNKLRKTALLTAATGIAAAAAITILPGCKPAAAGNPQSALSTPQPPNIILILIDDMGYGDIGPFGSTVNRTPNLDRMAAEGLRLTSFYAAPVCTPSRAQFMTGCYAKRVGLGHGVLFPAGANGLNPRENTVAKLLKAQGYATMCVGKWHLGDQPEFLPLNHGFDAYFGLPYSNDMGGGNAPAQPKKGKKGKANDNPRPPLPLVRDNKPVEVITPEKQDHLTQRYTDVAVQFIRDHVAANAAASDSARRRHVAQTAKSADGGSAAAPIQNRVTERSEILASKIQNPRPFFLYFPHTAVHVPLHPGPNFAGKSANGKYGDWVEEVDWSIGRVLDTVRELGIANNTLVIFTSDNGPWATKGRDGGVATPLRGAKGGTFEGGVRVPAIAWWPGKVPAGASSGAITGNIDFLPTVVALAGGRVPAGNKIDGVDISPVLLGKARESARKVHYFFDADNNDLQAVRRGPWKLAIARQSEKTTSYALNKPDPDFVPCLYNLDADIGETTDVAAANPEIVAQLLALAAEMDKDLGNKKPDGPGVRPAGRVATPVGLWLPGQSPSAPVVDAHYD